ncbi:MAG TPA: squalene--hopene cyclase, partial [Thermodesulfobacteriaceae bacterium]|nr:squalene--hopene cyclase [Thermodesulfobacteriaceae bacterium]
PFHPFRNLARTKCIEWIIRHQDADGIWGGIQPPTIYSLMALHHEGYRLDHPVLARCFHALDTHWSHEVDGCIYIHASESPVWDTLLSVMAQLDCGLEPGGSDSMYRAIHWLMDRFVEAPGDWQVYVRGVQTGAWAFERANTWYPDVDDTAVALTVLARIRRFMKDSSAIDRAMSIATGWIEAMQCSNGGWAAFDRDNDSRLVTRIPFCDFGEALDPPSVDVTAHVLEAFGLMGRGMDDPVVARAIQYVKNEQEPEGSWFGRWGVNHIYGTAAVLPALEAVGEDMSSQYCIRAGDWIAAHQNTDGGWGESCGSYMDDSLRGKGESTASQTGWALMALLALKADKYRKAVDEGVRWLLDRQKKDGTWDEPQYTGTGFPGYGIGKRTNLEKAAEELDQGAELARGFMINYNMYRHYFPLMALGRARKWLWR